MSRSVPAHPVAFSLSPSPEERAVSNSENSMSRRRFFDLATGVAGAALTSGRLGAQTAPRASTDKVRLALIGSGGRGRSVAASFVRNLADVQYVAACDAYKSRLDQGIRELSELQKDLKVEAYRGLPAHPRAQGHRCRAHRDAGPLALSDADRRHGGWKRRVRREAAVQHGRTSRRGARRLQRIEPRRATGYSAALRRALSGGGEDLYKRGNLAK